MRYLINIGSFTKSKVLQNLFRSTVCYALTDSALARGSSTKIDSVLQALLNYLTSTPARIIAILAIVAVGYGTLHLGRIPKHRAVAVVIGVGTIFGGATILQMLGLGN